MRKVYLLLVFFIFLSCEKDEDNHPEYKGNYIYSSQGSGEISTIHWISNAEIVVVEHEFVVDTIYNIINAIKIIDIQSNSIKNIDLNDGQIQYSVISDNNKFIFYSVVVNTFSDNLMSIFRLDLATGEQLLLIDSMGMMLSPFCVSSDGSKLAYHKNSSDLIYIYDIPDNKEVSLTLGHPIGYPILFTHDNTGLLINTRIYYAGPLTLYSYNLESGQSQLVISDQIINYLNSDFNPNWLINAIKDNGNILLIISGSENNFLIYNLTEKNPIFGGTMDSYNVYSDENLICEYGSQHYGCNFAIDTRKMKMFYWTFDCLEKVYEGWGYRCSPYRYNLYSTDIISKDKTRIGNILNVYPGTTAISPDGTKVVYVLGRFDGGPRYKSVYAYNISE